MSFSEDSKKRMKEAFSNIRKQNGFREHDPEAMIDHFADELLRHYAPQAKYSKDNSSSSLQRARSSLRSAISDSNDLVKRYTNTVEEEAKLDRAYYLRLLGFRVGTAFLVPFVAIIGLSLGAALLKCFGVDIIALNLLRMVSTGS